MEKNSLYPCPCCNAYVFKELHCFEICPVCKWENARQKQVGNNTVYEFDDNGRTVQVIKNPDWKQGDKKAQYIEVETTNGQISVKHEDRVLMVILFLQKQDIQQNIHILKP